MHRLILVTALACLCGLPAHARERTANTCAVTKPRAVSAFLRRLARDAGNTLAPDSAIPDGVRYGLPVGAAERDFGRKLVRLWGHTENKLHRKCRAEDATAILPGHTASVPDATDYLFTTYGLPWVRALHAIASPYGQPCVQLALVQSGYAIRDQVPART